MRLEAKS